MGWFDDVIQAVQGPQLDFNDPASVAQYMGRQQFGGALGNIGQTISNAGRWWEPSGSQPQPKQYDPLQQLMQMATMQHLGLQNQALKLGMPAAQFKSDIASDASQQLKPAMPWNFPGTEPGYIPPTPPMATPSYTGLPPGATEMRQPQTVYPQGSQQPGAQSGQVNGLDLNAIKTAVTADMLVPGSGKAFLEPVELQKLVAARDRTAPGSPDRALLDVAIRQKAGAAPVPLREGDLVDVYAPGGPRLLWSGARLPEGMQRDAQGNTIIAPNYLPEKERLNQQSAAAAGDTTASQERAKAKVGFGEGVGGGQTSAPREGPGYSEPIPTKTGGVLPPVSDQPSYQNTPPNVLAAHVPIWAKRSNEIMSAIPALDDSIQRIETMANALKAVQSGKGTEGLATAAAWLKRAGIDISNVTDPAAVQTLIKGNIQATLDKLKAVTNRFTQAEFKITSQNFVNANLEPEANLEMIAGDLGQLKRLRAQADGWRQSRMFGWHDVDSFESSWSNHNPLSKYVDDARSSIGPLKGMTNAETPVTRGRVPNAPAIPALPPGTTKQHIEDELRRRGAIR